MKAFSGILVMAAMVMQTIIGYHLVSEVLPSWITFWAISTALTYVGFVGSVIAGVQEK